MNDGVFKADLHIHSSFSDGELTPLELVRSARELGLSTISIADHDTIDGVEEAVTAGNEDGVEVIPATELSTIFNGLDIHILGYFIDTKDEVLNRALKKFADARAGRAEKMVNNLRSQGIKIDFAEVEMEAGKGSIGRPHIASVLHKKGFVGSFEEAFYYYIGTRSPVYVRKYDLKPREAVDLIQGASGLAVLAHPFVGNLGEDGVLELLECGVDGIEVKHPKMSPADSERLMIMAGKRGLLMTGGSDYHGDNRGSSFPGDCAVPESYVKAMKDALRAGMRGSSGCYK